MRTPQPEVSSSQSRKTGDLNPLPRSRFRAVTVLHKPCSTLGYTLTNFASNLGPDWPILLLHNDEVSSQLKQNKIVRLQRKHGILHTASLETNGFPALTSRRSYSKLLSSTRFWSAMKAQHILIFQTDSALCSMSPWTINDFLKYDYIGAPWIDRWYGMEVGNGGLSLRKTKTMILITESFKFNETENEDIYFARGTYELAARGLSINIPPVHVAAKFAYEAGKLPRVTSFGVHKTPKMKVDKDAVTKTCPEAMGAVWGGCQVEAYVETFAFMQRNRRFLAGIERMNVLDFEKDYVVSRHSSLKVSGKLRPLPLPSKHTMMDGAQGRRVYRVHLVLLLLLLLIFLLILLLLRTPRESAHLSRSGSLHVHRILAYRKKASWLSQIETRVQDSRQRDLAGGGSRKSVACFS